MRLTMMLTFILFVNVLMFLGQTSIDKLNPDGTGLEEDSRFFNYDGSWLSAKDDGDFVLNEDLDTSLPQSQSSVDVTDGNVFTDTWRTLSSWLTERVPGVDFLGRVINGPSGFLKAAGLPAEISFAIGWLWHILGIFLFVTWIRGGQS